MKKTLFILNEGVYPYRTGGMEIFNYHLIRSLSEKGPIAYMGSHKYDFDSAEFVKSCTFKPTKFFTPLWLLIFLIFHKGYKQVVFSFSSAHWLVWKIYTITVKLLGLESIVVIHHGKEAPRIKTEIYKDFFKSAKTVVAVSDAIKDNYDKAYGLDCKIIYPLIPFKTASYSSEYYRDVYSVPRNSNVIIMVGTLKQMKNPQTLLKALMLFDKHELEFYKPYVVYAGSGPMVEELQQYVENQSISEYVKFLGIIPNDKICEIMCIADIYVIASDFEGTSVSLLEAMYNCKPIIASDVPGLRDMITDGTDGLLFDVKSATELKSKLIYFLSNSEFRNRMGMAAEETFKSKYDYAKIIDMYQDILR